MIKLLIADDHQLFIDGVKTVIQTEPEIEIVGQALNGEEVLSFLENNNVDVILMDINMPVLDGIETSKIILKKYQNTKVLMLTMHNIMEFINQIIKLGVAGYILKTTSREDLIYAVKKVASGENYFCKEVTETLVESIKSVKNSKSIKDEIHLTKREIEIINYISQEFTTLEIAKFLGLSHHTVESQRRNLLSKLEVRNTVGIVKYAIDKKII